MDFGSILSPEKWWLLLVTVLLGINTGVILPAQYDSSAPAPRKWLIISTWLLNGILTGLAGLLFSQEKPNFQLCQGLTIGGAIVGVVTLAIFFRGPKAVVTAHDRRSELLGVLKEEYGQRETGAVLGKSIAPVPLEPPRSIPFLGKLFGFGQERSLSGLDDLLKTFDEAQRQVLILGEPGAGKTTLLVALANRLVQRAIEGDREPIPVILELSAWRAGESLPDWIVAEVAERYRPLPAAQVANWLATGQLLPLLDGLDELKDRQGAAMVAINEWVSQSQKLAGVVVCCRRAEYDAAVAAGDAPLEERLNKRIELQPLDEATIRTHLHDCERDFLWEKIKQDRDGFRKLAESPLLLDLMVAAYDKPGKWQREAPRNPDDLAAYYLDCRDRLLDDYFEVRLHSVPHPKYKPADTRRYLEWLARLMRDRNQTEFLIEYMQPDLIEDLKDLKGYRDCLGFIAAIPLALGSWLLGVVLNEEFYGLVLGLGIGLQVFCSMEILYIRISKTIWSDISLLFLRGRIFILFIFQSFLKGEFIGNYFFAPLLILTFCGYFYVLSSVFNIENQNHLSYFLISIPFLFIVAVVALGAILESNSLYLKKISYKETNEGTIESRKSLALLTFLFFLLFFINQSISTIFQNKLSWEVTFFHDIPIACILSGLMGFYYFGGIQIFQKKLLFIFLNKANHIPINYDDFLQYASDKLSLLKKSGAYFRFYHELLKINMAKFSSPACQLEAPRISLKSKLIALLIQLILIYLLIFACLNINSYFDSSNSSFLNSLDLKKSDIVFRNSIINSRFKVHKNSLVLVNFMIKTETNHSHSNLSIDLIGKVVQLPGDTINLGNKYLFAINGKSINEIYKDAKTWSSLCFDGKLRVPQDSYVVLLQWVDEPWLVLVKEKDIQTKILFRIYPFDRFGPIEP
ncbi:MAG: NACHT domain-containing protein [Limnothrix sp. BL-A-16]